MSREEYLARVEALRRCRYFPDGDDWGWIDSGWLSIVENMFEQLEDVVAPNDTDAVNIWAIKEKFGLLYVVYVPDRSRPSIDRAVSVIIDEAMERSKSACQFCGAAASWRLDEMPVMTKCNVHTPFGHDARVANFALFSSPDIVPEPPPLEAVRAGLLAARDDLFARGVERLAVAGPNADGERSFVALWKERQPAAVPKPGERRWSLWHDGSRIVGWPWYPFLLGEKDAATYWAKAGGADPVDWLWER